MEEVDYGRFFETQDLILKTLQTLHHEVMDKLMSMEKLLTDPIISKEIITNHSNPHLLPISPRNLKPFKKGSSRGSIQLSVHSKRESSIFTSAEPLPVQSRYPQGLNDAALATHTTLNQLSNQCFHDMYKATENKFLPNPEMVNITLHRPSFQTSTFENMRSHSNYSLPRLTTATFLGTDVKEVKKTTKVPINQHSYIAWICRISYLLLLLIEFTWIGARVAKREWTTDPTLLEIIVASISCLFFTLLICSEFLISRRIEWEIVDSYKGVAKSYLRSWFIFDLLVTLPYDLIALHFSPMAFRLLQCLRCFRVVRIPFLFQSKHPLRKISVKVRGTLGLVVASLGIQAIALVWMGIRNQSDQMMVDFQNSIYWAIQTLSTVGYGDVFPNSQLEKMYCSAIMLLGTSTFGYLVGNMSMILLRTDMQRQLETEKRERLLGLMEFYKVPWNVQKDVMELFPHLLKSSLATKDHSDILLLFPTTIQQKINRYIKLELLSAVPFFSGSEEGACDLIADKLVEMVLPQNHCIVQSGEYGDQMYFIADGMVEVLLENESTGEATHVAHLHAGHFFGEICLLLRVPRTATVKSVTPVTLFSLSYSDFEDILKNFPKLYQTVAKEASTRMAALKSSVYPIGLNEEEDKTRDEQLNNSQSSPNAHVLAAIEKWETHTKRNKSSRLDASIGETSRNPLNSPDHSENINYSRKSLEIDTFHSVN